VQLRADFSPQEHLAWVALTDLLVYIAPAEYGRNIPDATLAVLLAAGGWSNHFEEFEVVVC
jgi:hypothetical protein